MNIDDACREYPAAWYTIGNRMADLQDDTDAILIPFTADLVKVGEQTFLEVTVLSDLVEEGLDENVSLIKFRAPIDPVATTVH